MTRPHLYARVDTVRRILSGCVLGLAGLTVLGCAGFDPTIDPDVADLQLMLHSLQAAARDHDRAMAELRAELDGRRQELSAAVVARAQLEGRLHDVERRWTESRHIIELQREELLAGRAERERLLLSQAQAAAKPKHARKTAAPRPPADASPAPPTGMPAPDAAPAAAAAPIPIPAPATIPPPELQGAVPQLQSQAIEMPAAETDAGLPGRMPQSGQVIAAAEGVESGTVTAVIRNIVVQAGDTLYSLARRYGVDLRELRAANGLYTDLIVVGQALLLPPPAERRIR